MAKPKTKRAAKRSTRGPKGKETATTIRTKRFKPRADKHAGEAKRQDVLPGIPAPPPSPPPAPASSMMTKKTIRLTNDQAKRLETLQRNEYLFGVMVGVGAGETLVLRTAIDHGILAMEKMARERASAQAQFPGVKG